MSEIISIGLIIIAFIVFIAFIIFICIIPGIIATRRNHAYKGIIWILGIIGIFNGITWVVAIVWALWPQEKSLIDPFLGNVTGTGVRNSGDTIGSAGAGITMGRDAEINLRNELAKFIKMRDDGLITEEEYQKKRQKLLGL